MSNNALVEDASVRTDTETRGGRWQRYAKVGAAVLAGGALFLGGALVANGLDRGGDVVSEAANTVVLQNLGVLTQQADVVIAQVQTTDPADLEAQQQLGVQLQVLAVAMDELPPQASDAELREVAQLITDGYLQLSVGIVTNSGTQTSRGAETLAQSKERLEQFLGTPVQAPGQSDQGADEGDPAVPPQSTE